MKAFERAVMVLVLTILVAGGARAQSELPSEPPRERAPLPGASVVAATANVVYAPVRLAFTVLQAELGGLVGFLTAGNAHAAEDVWQVFDGQAFLSREAVSGREPIRFGDYQYDLLLITPGY